MSLGNTLRTAREAHGITTSELAARTHMLVQIVEGLENEDFRRIPAPIYGRGFIKLYCEAVNLDPKPLQAEFMELFNRGKDAPPKPEPVPVRRRQPEPQPAVQTGHPVPPPQTAIPEPQTVEPPIRPVEPASAPEPMSGAEENIPDVPAAPEQEQPVRPDAEQPPMSDFGELFSQPAAPAPAVPAAEPPVRQPARRSYGDLFGQTYAADEGAAPKPSAAEKFRTTMSNVSSGVFANVQKLPPNTGRIIAVSVLAIVVFTLIGWGVAVLYKATTPGEADAIEKAVPAETAETDKTKPSDGKKVDEDKKDLKKDAAKNSDGSKNRPADPKTAAAAKPVQNVNPGELKSSGIEIPALYID